jgi:hypothetical protein
MKLAVSLPPDRAKSAAFVQACFALAQGHTQNRDPLDYLPKGDHPAKGIVQRAIAEPGNSTDAGFAAEVVGGALRAFLIDLQQYSGAARLIAQAVPATLTGFDEAHYPVRTGGRKIPTWVAELDAIPVVSGSFADVVIGPARKMSHIIVWSREVARRPDAGAIFAQMLREDVGAGIDGAFFAATAATDSAPAGLLYDLTSQTPSGRSGDAGVRSDLGALAETVAAGGSGACTFIMAPERLARLRIEAPEVAQTADIVPSAAVPAGRIIAVDGPSLLVAVDPAPDIYASEHACIHMSDDPGPIVPEGGPASDPIRSLWQTGSVAMRVMHDIDFKTRRSGAVAFTDGASWW